jgi:fatty-acyl-CoA synthase
MPSDSATPHPRLHQGVFQPHLLVHALSHDLDRPVLYTDDDNVLTARDLRECASRYCQALASYGLEPGTRIGMLAGNLPEVLHVSHACMLNQYVFVPLHPRGAIEDWVYVAEDANLQALVFDPTKFDDSAAKIRERSPALKHLLALGESKVGNNLRERAERYTAQPLQAPALRGDELYRLSYSGGTTGQPKAIMGTHSYAATTLNIQLTEWEWPQELRQLLCAPLSHSGAAVMMPTLLRGGAVWMQPGFDPLRVLQAIERHRITCVLLVPTMIYALLDHPRFHEFDLSSLETIFYGASSISPARLREAIEKIGPVFFQFYGQAEAPMTVTVLRRSEHTLDDPLRLASCGRPVPWVHVALLDDQHREVPDGQPGEICVRGALVMAGYLNRPDLTREVFAGDWLHTGDVAIKDSQGFLRIVDRKKDMIISGGFNIYPREIEDILCAHPAVAQCAVIGVRDAHWGEAVKAVVVLRSAAQPCAAELIALVREKKGAVQAPKSVDFVESIPLTAVGKPDKKVLRARYTTAD